jgi:hypothetical protein
MKNRKPYRVSFRETITTKTQTRQMKNLRTEKKTTHTHIRKNPQLESTLIKSCHNQMKRSIGRLGNERRIEPTKSLDERALFAKVNEKFILPQIRPEFRWIDFT